MRPMKRNNPAGTIVLLASLLVAGPSLGRAQSTSADSPKPAGQETSKKSEGKKPALAEATRVSTEEAARSVAKEQSKQSSAKAEDEETSASGVTEFHPVKGDRKSAPEDRSGEENSQGGTLKNIHGTVEGAADSSGSGNRVGAAVGGSSRGGKTSIYVKTERDRGNPPSR